jgi:hypothetical protein
MDGTDKQNTGSEKPMIRCRTCGDYFPSDDAVKDVFCSNVCATKYTRCVNCGSFFTKLYKDDPPYCSPECREKYSDMIKSIKIDEIEGEFI